MLLPHRSRSIAVDQKLCVILAGQGNHSLLGLLNNSLWASHPRTLCHKLVPEFCWYVSSDMIDSPPLRLLVFWNWGLKPLSG